MLTLEQIDAALRKKGVSIPGEMALKKPEENYSPGNNMTTPSLTLEQIDAALAKKGVQAPKQEGFMHRLGQLGRGFVGAMGAEHGAMPHGGANMALPYEDLMENEERFKYGHPSEVLPESVGLGKQFEPSEGDTTGKILKGTGEFLSPSPFMAFGGYGNVAKAGMKGGLKGGTKALGKDLGIATGLSTLTHGTPRMAEEGTGLGALEDLTKTIGGGAALSAAPAVWRKGARTWQRILDPIEDIEKGVSQHLKSSIGEENVPKVLKNLITPSTEPEFPSGYKPTTAEIANNPTFSQLQRMQEGRAGSGITEHQGLGAAKIVNALDNAELSKEDMLTVQDYVKNRLNTLERGVEQEVQNIGNRLEAPEAGRQIREGVHQSLLEKKKIRRDATRPLYREVKELKDELNPENALKHLNDDEVSGTAQADYNYYKKELSVGSSKKDLKEWERYQHSLKNAEQAGPEALSLFHELNNPPKKIYPSVRKLAEVRKALNSDIKVAARAGDDHRALKLRELKAALDKDLENVPIHMQATAKYKELSPPVNAITGQPALKRVVKQRDKEFTMTESRVPDVFVNSSAGSIDDSKALLAEIREKPKALEAVRAYLNDKAAKFIVNPKTGKVDVNKVAAFKHKYPGAEILHPDLIRGKLKNVQNAQAMTNQYFRKNEAVSKNLYRNALGEFTGKNPKNIINNVFDKNSSHNMGRILETVSEDKSGKALEGLRRSTIDHFYNSITNAGFEGEHPKLSYPKMRKFMQNHEAALQKVLTPEQIKVIKEVEKIVEGKQKAASLGIGPGSPTHANTMNALDVSQASGFSMSAIKALGIKVGIATPLIKQFFKDRMALRRLKTEEVLNKALLDPNYAAVLLATPLKSEKDMKAFLNNMKVLTNPRYISPPLLKAIEKEQEENEE